MNPTILIVDDDPDIREMLRSALGKDYNVLEADDGMAGLSEVLLNEEDIDLIVTDLRMPNMDGIELIEELPRKIPLVIISGFLYHSEYAEQFERLNPFAVIEKPFQLPVLLETISTCLNPSPSQSQ